MIEVLKQHTFFTDKSIESCTLLEHQGYCNENYLVLADGVKYIVRIFKEEGIDRKLEFYYQKLAYRQGISPEPFLLDELNNLMIMKFQEGKHKAFLSLKELDILIEMIKKLHSHDIDNDDNITTALCRYELARNSTQAVINALDEIDCYAIEYVLCHNDLNAKNILWYDDQAVLLDFEYAAVNDCYFDLASISVEFSLSESEDIHMLDLYFGDEFYDEAKLDAYKVIYNAVCEEWFKENP